MMVKFNCSGLCGKISFCVTLTQLFQKLSGNPENSNTGLVKYDTQKSKLYKVMCKHPTAANRLTYCTISNLVHTVTRCETKKKAIDFSQSAPTIKKFWSWVNSVKHYCANLLPLHSENTLKLICLTNIFILFLLMRILTI